MSRGVNVTIIWQRRSLYVCLYQHVGQRNSNRISLYTRIYMFLNRDRVIIRSTAFWHKLTWRHFALYHVQRRRSNYWLFKGKMCVWLKRAPKIPTCLLRWWNCFSQSNQVTVMNQLKAMIAVRCFLVTIAKVLWLSWLVVELVLFTLVLASSSSMEGKHNFQHFPLVENRNKCDDNLWIYTKASKNKISQNLLPQRKEGWTQRWRMRETSLASKDNTSLFLAECSGKGEKVALCLWPNLQLTRVLSERPLYSLSICHLHEPMSLDRKQKGNHT